jgi:hypothetical protein
MRGTAVIVATVENLSMTRAKPVEILLMKISFAGESAQIVAPTACGWRLRDPLRLIVARRALR